MKIRTFKVIESAMLNHWYFIISLSPYWQTSRSSLFQFGIFKLKEFPPEGETFQKRHYDGFWFRQEIELPTFGFSHNFKKSETKELKKDEKKDN